MDDDSGPFAYYCALCFFLFVVAFCTFSHSLPLSLPATVLLPALANDPVTTLKT